MTKKSFIDSVGVNEPCPKEWDKMIGGDRVRFCGHCAKDVQNISSLTRKDAMRMVRGSDGNLCIRYVANPVTQRPMFAEQIYQITRRAPGIAAGVMTASLGFSTLAFGQSSAPPETTETTSVERQISSESSTPNADNVPAYGQQETVGSIKGTVRDLNGKPVDGIEITVVSVDPKIESDATSTDENGEYSFPYLLPGKYTLRIDSSSGFRKKVTTSMTISGEDTIIQDLNVTPVVAVNETEEPLVGRGFGMSYGGAIAMVEYSLPLSRAVADGDIDRVRQLISEGAKVNGKDKNYSDITPLFLAIENGNVEIVRTLLDYGAKVNVVDSTKRTPLMFIDGDATVELIEMLTRAGAKVNAVDNDGNTALRTAIETLKPEIVQALIDAGADVNQVNNSGDTALMRAVDSASLEIVKALVMAGASINARDKNGESAWDKSSDASIEEYLMTYGAAVDIDSVETTGSIQPKENN